MRTATGLDPLRSLKHRLSVSKRPSFLRMMFSIFLVCRFTEMILWLLVVAVFSPPFGLHYHHTSSLSRLALLWSLKLWGCPFLLIITRFQFSTGAAPVGWPLPPPVGHTCPAPLPSGRNFYFHREKFASFGIFYSIFYFLGKIFMKNFELSTKEGKLS